MRLEPAFDAFAGVYADGRAQVVWTRVIDDLETPVSAFLKMGHGRPYACLFESVEGGAWRGRYSFVALEPDLVWRAFGERAETAEGADIAAGRFKVDDKPALPLPARPRRRLALRSAGRPAAHGRGPVRRSRLRHDPVGLSRSDPPRRTRLACRTR